MKIKHRPYKLPEPIVMDPADLDEYGLPAMDDLKELIQIHGTRLRRYDYLENLFLGFHDIFRQPERENWKPDWRLACAFPYYIVKTFTGYGYSIPVKISHESKEITNEIRNFLLFNEFEELFTQIVTDCSIYGHTWTYLYQDEDAKTNITEFTPKEFFCVYDDTLKKRALFCVRYGVHTVGQHKGEMYGEVMSPFAVRRFDHGDWTGPAEPNAWGKIPAVEWMLNDYRMGLFEQSASLIELYDHTLSEKGNDVDSFAEAILAIIGPEIDIDEEDIRSKTLINIFGDPEEIKNTVAEYLQKPVADGTQEHLLDRLERHIYQFCQTANISDDDFGSATSGISLAYKLWSTSNIVTDFNTKCIKSLKKIFKLWGLWGTNTSVPDAYKDLTFKFTPNLPRNLKEETETARLADGIVSKRKQLSLLSYVDDPDDEINQIKKEEKDLIGSYNTIDKGGDA